MTLLMDMMGLSGHRTGGISWEMMKMLQQLTTWQKDGTHVGQQGVGNQKREAKQVQEIYVYCLL